MHATLFAVEMLLAQELEFGGVAAVRWPPVELLPLLTARGGPLAHRRAVGSQPSVLRVRR